MVDGIIDLHVHSKCSDGFDDVKKIIETAKRTNVKYLSLTEHYNISSYKLACELAGDDIEIIKGIELGTDMSIYNDENKHICHILAYYISNDIYKLLDLYEVNRYNCALETIRLLNKNNICITIEDVIDYSREKESIGRYDVAIALKKLGYVKSINEAYSNYLNYGEMGYVKRAKLDPFELIRRILEYGGVPVLAHPRSLRMKSEEEVKFIKKLVDEGLSGIEVYNPNNGKERRNRYLKLCKEYCLVPTVGSDYHRWKKKTNY